MNDNELNAIRFRDIRCAWNQKLASGFCRNWKEHRAAGLYKPLFALVLFALAATVSAQPTMTRGQQILAISYEECLRRAQSAFSTEGWVNGGTSGNAVAAFKSIHGSYIVCNPAPDNKMAVNIFVTSSSNDSGVPGAERVRLQGRMDQSGGVTQSEKWRLTIEVPAGQPYAGTYSIEMALTEQNGNLSGKGRWSNGPESNFTGTIRNGEVVLYRVDGGGFRGTFWGRLTANGRMEGTGRNDPSSPGGNNSSYTWSAIRLQ